MVNFVNEHVSSDAGLVFGNQIIQEGYLSTESAAKILDKSPNAIRIMVNRGQLKAYKDGARLKFRFADIKQSLKRKGM